LTSPNNTLKPKTTPSDEQMRWPQTHGSTSRYTAVLICDHEDDDQSKPISATIQNAKVNQNNDKLSNNYDTPSHNYEMKRQ